MLAERNAVTWVAWLVVWVGASLTGCGDDGAASPVGVESGGPQRSDPVAARDDHRYVAVLAAHEAIDVAARHEGILREVLVRPGERVDEGQVLCRLDDLAMKQALALARAGRRTAEAVIAQREVEIAEAQRALEIEQELVAGGIGAEKNLEEAKFARERARKARDYAQAQLAEQNARITQLERQLREAVVVAPFAGTISLRYRDPGALVAPGTSLVRLIRGDSLWVKFAVPPEVAAALAVGDAVTTHLESPAVRLPAVVRHISPELDPAARLIFIEAELRVPEDLEGKLRAGLPAWVSRDG